LNLDTEGIVKLVDDYDRDTKALKQELLKMTWFMRGGINYEQAHLLTPDERLIIGKIIEEHLETTKESGLPFF
jgi:hypothetical protein